MAAAALDRRHARSVELACECQAISAEIADLTAALASAQARECAIHARIAQRAEALMAESRELAGILDGAA